MDKDIIEKVVEKIKEHRSFYEQSEMAVREGIVNPILRGLGWDTENPEEVQPNVFSKEGIPDYSLLKNNKKVLFIEAKKLSVDIVKREVMRQLARYCFGAGMEYGVLTNGSIWVLFRAFQKDTTIEERTVWKTDIENDDITATIRRLNTISRENIGNIETLIKKLQILDKIWQSLLNEPKDLVKGFIPVVDNLIKERYQGYEFPISEIEDFVKERVKELIPPIGETPPKPTPISSPPIGPRPSPPREMRIGTDTYGIRYSYDILVKTAEWLIAKGKLKRDDCPIVAGHRRNLVNTQPKHRYGDDFRAPRKLSNGLYIETLESTAGSIKSARRLLEKYKYQGNMLNVV